MKQIRIRCESARYQVHVGQGILGRTGRILKGLKAGPKVLIVTNRKVAGHFLKPIQRSLKKSGFQVSHFLLPYGTERDKTKEVLFRLWEHMASIPLDRSSTLVAIGGGVVGDLSGFAAASYMRGIKVVHVPTTLLAQVDSAIGGKTAIDLAVAKNIVGAFHQPSAVIADIRTLETMTLSAGGRRALRASFAEVIKYGVILDTQLFKLLERKKEELNKCFSAKKWTLKQRQLFETVVWRSAKAKAYVISEDEFETKGLRMILNFGHTFAHGFESASRYRLSHGEAVAVGMACAAALGVKLRTFSKASSERLLNLIEGYGLPVDVNRLRLGTSKVIYSMQRDKKRTAKGLNFVVPKSIGKVVVRESIAADLIRQIIRKAGTK